MASVLDINHCARLSIRDHPTTLYQIEHRPVPDQKLLKDIQIDLPGSPNPKQLLYRPILHGKKNAQMGDKPKNWDKTTTLFMYI